MRIIEVKDKSAINQFHKFPVKLYKDYPNWIRPITSDVEDVFNPMKNKSFRHGECERFLLEDNGEIIGRIAVFLDKKISKTYEQPTGGFGFFECINSKEAAFALFDKAKAWLEERGMEAMDGPVNFGDRDKFWGLLVDGDFEPNYNMPYNPPYYQDFFEEYGFKDYFQQYTYHRSVYDGDVDERMAQTAERIAKNPKYKVEYIDKRNLDRYADEFRIVYNKAWTRYSGVKEITIAHAKALLNSMKPILDNKLVYFAYYEDEPVGFLIMIPELNQIFKKFNGKLNLINKIRLIWNLRVTKGTSKALGIIFGIAEDHQGRGLEGAMVYAMRAEALKKSFPYKEVELNWIGDFNPTMRKLVELVGFKIKKTHITYRFLFDRTKEFSRAKKVS